MSVHQMETIFYLEAMELTFMAKKGTIQNLLLEKIILFLAKFLPLHV